MVIIYVALNFYIPEYLRDIRTSTFITNILELNLPGLKWKVTNWDDSAQDRGYRRALMNAALILRVP